MSLFENFIVLGIDTSKGTYMKLNSFNNYSFIYQILKNNL